jgi:hypothetical protein
MFTLNDLSLHPKLAAVLDVVVNVIMLWRVLQINSWWTLFALIALRVAAWALLIRLVYYPPKVSRLRHFFSLLIFMFGALAVMLFVDWRYVWYLLGGFFVALPMFSFWLLPAQEDKLFLISKHHRRWLLLMNVFGIGGLWNGLTAMIAFQVLNINSWFLILPVITLSVAVAVWWWHEYGLEIDRKFWIWTIAFALLLVEMSWVILLNPFGNFAQGLILTWIWYVLWLIIRFYLSKEGVDWHRQRWFLGFNLLLLILFLVFLVRWN